MGTIKQADPASEPSTDPDMKMATLAAHKASLTKNDNLSQSKAGALSKRRDNCDAGKRGDVDMSEDIALLKDLLTDREDEIRKAQEKYLKQKDKYKKLSDDYDYQHSTLEKCRSSQDLYKGIFNHVLDEGVDPYATQHGSMPDSWTAGSLKKVITPMCRDALETASLRKQVNRLQEEVQVREKEIRALQDDMLAKVEKIKAVNDEAFAQEFRNITSLVKTLSREVRFINQASALDILASGKLLTGVPQAHWENRTNKKSLTEAWFWSVLLDRVFRCPFAFLGAQCHIISVVWQHLFGLQHSHEWPTPTALSETWRYTTIDQMLEQTKQGVMLAGKLKKQYSELEKDMVEDRTSIVILLQRGLTPESSTKHLPKMKQLADKAFTLAAKMGLQRARFQVTYPKVGDKFDEHAMAPLFNADGDCIEKGVVAFIVNPGLAKWGDAHGKNLDHRYDIVPSLVQLDIQDPKQVVNAAHADVVKLEA